MRDVRARFKSRTNLELSIIVNCKLYCKANGKLLVIGHPQSCNGQSSVIVSFVYNVHQKQMQLSYGTAVYFTIGYQDIMNIVHEFISHDCDSTEENINNLFSLCDYIGPTVGPEPLS